jgi:hypothetical protein
MVKNVNKREWKAVSMSNGFFERDGSAPSIAGELVEEQEEVRHPVPPVRRRAHPMTPVPPRASAYPGRTSSVWPRYTRISAELEQLEDIAQLPTQPTYVASRQHEEGDVADEDTASMPASVAYKRDSVPESSLEEDTAPCPLPQYVEPDIAELDTQPPDQTARAKKGTRRLFAAAPEDGPTGGNTGETEIVETKRVLAFRPFDHVRWWLLYPGRLEFVLWLSGALFLLIATCLLLLFSFLSVSSTQNDNVRATEAIGSDSPSFASCSPMTCGGSISVTSVAGVQLTLLDTGQVLVNESLHLEGQGFTPHGAVNLTYDDWLPCQPAIVHADAYGTFRVTVLLTHAGAGDHRITAYDAASTHTIVLPIKLIAK